MWPGGVDGLWPRSSPLLPWLLPPSLLWGDRDADLRLLLLAPPPLEAEALVVLLSRSLPDDVRILPLRVLGTKRFVKLLIVNILVLSIRIRFEFDSIRCKARAFGSRASV